MHLKSNLGFQAPLSAITLPSGTVSFIHQRQLLVGEDSSTLTPNINRKLLQRTTATPKGKIYRNDFQRENSLKKQTLHLPPIPFAEIGALGPKHHWAQRWPLPAIRVPPTPTPILPVSLKKSLTLTSLCLLYIGLEDLAPLTRGLLICCIPWGLLVTNTTYRDRQNFGMGVWLIKERSQKAKA